MTESSEMNILQIILKSPNGDARFELEYEDDKISFVKNYLEEKIFEGCKKYLPSNAEIRYLKHQADYYNKNYMVWYAENPVNVCLKFGKRRDRISVDLSWNVKFIKSFMYDYFCEISSHMNNMILIHRAKSENCSNLGKFLSDENKTISEIGVKENDYLYLIEE